MVPDKLDEEKRDRSAEAVVVNGETAFRLFRADLKKGDRRVWQPGKGVVYFGCPRCSKILMLEKEEIDRYKSSTCYVIGGRAYQSIWCKEEHHHLWVDFYDYQGD